MDHCYTIVTISNNKCRAMLANLKLIEIIDI